MVCPSCQAENKEGAKFCNECGTPLALRCPDCGTAHRPGQKFCDECGRALQPSTPLPPAGVAGAATAPLAGAPDAGASPAEMRLVSVLFVDLVGFTSLSEAREAEDVRELLGRYFESARTIVERYGGVVEKFIGDAVMAVWGAPVAREDDAERAVRAALDVVDAVGAFGQEVGAPELRARAGVVTGQVAALENPGEGLVVGDRVNTASRVQSAAAPGTVLVDEVTRQVTSAAIAYEDAGEHTVKGKVEPLVLWRAVRVVAGVGGSDREQGLEAAFVGRDGDVRLLKELFHGALDRGSARLVAVSGEAGVGKSRLRREFFNYIDGLSDTILWHLGRCLAHGTGVSYWALAEMVRQRFGIAEEAAVEDAARKLDEGLERWVEDAADRDFIRPRLGALLGVAEPGLAREELFAGWRLFFERLASHLPVVLVFEDLQYADSGLLDFIEQLLDWSASSPIFILTLARPELAARAEGWPAGRRGATTIPLEPLGEAAMRALLGSLVEGLPAQAAERIVARAEGVPLYAIETVRALAARGALKEGAGDRLVPVGEIGELDVPASLNSLLAARLDALDPVERGLVKAMSVFGGSFPRSAAAVLGGVREDHVDAVLASLVRKQVLIIRADRLSPDRGQYAFAQGLLRTVAYGLLSRQERKPRHLAAAEHLRRAFANDGEDVAEVIASHYLEAYRAAGEDSDAEGLRAETVSALRRSARRAATVGAPEVAERAYLTAIELAGDEDERMALTQLAGEMALQSGRREAAIELLEAVAAAHRAAGRARDEARIAGEIGRALGRLGRNIEAAERIAAALETFAGEEPDQDVAVLTARLGAALYQAGDYDRAGVSLQRALQLAQAFELPDVLGDALASQASMYGYSGRVQESRYLFLAALDIAERHDLPSTFAIAQGNLGNLAMAWDLPEAARLVDAVLVIDRRRGDRYGESIDAGNRMQLHLFSGTWREAEQLAVELLPDDGQRPAGEYVHYVLVLLCALKGELAAARAHLDRIDSWIDAENEELLACHAASSLALLLAEGNAEAALDRGRRMLERSLERLSAAHETVRYGWPATLQAALELGRLAEASELLAMLSERPPGHVPPYLRAELIRGRALLAAAQGDHETVETDLRDAIERFRELAYPYWLATAEADLAQWLLGRGRAGEASPLLDEALATFSSLGAAPALARAEALSASLSGAAVS